MRESRQFAVLPASSEPPVHRPLHPLHGKHRQILQRRWLHVVQHRLKPTPVTSITSVDTMY
eukprot:744032-Prymnesium_polylepis.1